MLKFLPDTYVSDLSVAILVVCSAVGAGRDSTTAVGALSAAWVSASMVISEAARVRRALLADLVGSLATAGIDG